MSATGMGRGMAGAGDRIKAFFLDYLLVLAYLAALSVAGVLLTFGPLGSVWGDLFSTPLRMDAMAFALSVLPVMLFFAIGEASEGGATWGKRRVGIRVVDRAGSGIGFPRALARSALKFLPWQLSHTAMLHIPGFPQAPGDPPLGSLILLGLVWLLVAGYLAGLTALFGHRTPYDRLTGTRVVVAGEGR